MENILNNKLLWLIVFMTVFNVGAYLGIGVLVDKTTDKVIEKLQKEYSPSPYGPGIDPDRINPDVFKANR